MKKFGRKWLTTILVFLILTTNCWGAEFIQSYGSIWISGFFETAAGITGNDEMIYIADMNNSQIQAYNKTLNPLFHFGGYGSNPGNFIEIHGIYADNSSIFAASIDSYSQKKGKIQVFSKLGIFERILDNPDRRSDFLRVTKTRDNSIIGITENTICVYNNAGKIIKETNQALDIPFLFLQDITPLSDKNFAFVDRGRRGFFIANTAMNKVKLYGDEYISIPVAIASFMQKIYVADANGFIHCFSLDGKLLKSITTNLYINGLYLLNSNKLLATSALRRGLFEVDLTSDLMKEIKIEPTKDLELHWPSSIDADQDTIYMDDDYTGSIKMISTINGQFIKQIGSIDQSYIKAYDISVLDKSHIYALSKTNSSQIYEFTQNNEVQIMEGSENADYTALKSDHEESLYALDQQNQVIDRYIQNKRISQFSLPKMEEEVSGFFVTDYLYIIYQNGDLYILNKKTGNQENKILLHPIDRLDSMKNFIVTEDYIIVSCRECHQIKLFHRSTGAFFKTFGSIGGPKTYVQKENIGVDINFEGGKFLFPEGIIQLGENVYVADSGNHRIQKLPLHFLWDKDNTIILQIGSLVAIYNVKPIKMDTAPFLYQNRAMCPIRFISEILGAKVTWNGQNQKITITEENVTIEIWIGNKKMKVNNKEIIIDVPPIIRNNRTFVPLRVVTESLGGTVNWDPAKQTVTIRR